MRDEPSTDAEIRVALRSYILAHDSDTVIIDELPLQRGKGKADIAAINGRIVGYEIKSASDSLARLSRQIPLYDSIFERSYVVVAPRHEARVREAIPSHWGVIIATVEEGEVKLAQVRAAKLNPNIDKASLVRVLWRTEAIAVLRSCGVAIDSNALISTVWRVMGKSLSQAKSIKAARAALKGRGDSGSVGLRTQDGG